MLYENFQMTMYVGGYIEYIFVVNQRLPKSSILESYFTDNDLKMRRRQRVHEPASNAAV